MSRAHVLRAVADLTERHIGRTVTVGALTGTLTGLLPVGDRTALALIVGRSRAFTQAYAAETPIEVHQKETSQ